MALTIIINLTNTFLPVQYGVQFVMSHLLQCTVFSMHCFDVWVDDLIFSVY